MIVMYRFTNVVEKLALKINSSVLFLFCECFANIFLFEILTVVIMKYMIFWVVMLYSFVEAQQNFSRCM
jgi:hypothetical protein